MTIVRMRRMWLCGLILERPRVLDELQGLGCVHLVDDQPPEVTEEAGVQRHVERAKRALRDLGRVPAPRRQLHDTSVFDIDVVVDRVLVIAERRRELEDELDFPRERIRGLEPWGEFRLPPLEAVAGWRLWFYAVPRSQMRKLADCGLPWQIVYEDTRTCYVAVVSQGLPPHDQIPAPRTRTGRVPLSELRARVDQFENELEDLLAERQALSRWVHLIRRSLARGEDRAALLAAVRGTRDEGPVFAVQAWVPEDSVPAIESLARRHELALLVDEPGPEDRPPTMLRNPSMVAGAADVIGFYQMPGYRDWDPTPIVFFALATFFAMITADAGYAVLFGALLLWRWRSLGQSAVGARLRPLFATIVLVSLVYGGLVGSWFGTAPAEGAWLADIVVLDLNDFDAMMRVSVLIGCAHLALAKVVCAMHAPSLGRAMPHLGWIAVLVGGVMLWLGADTAAATIAPWVLGAGGAALVAFSSDRAVRTRKDFLMRSLGGLASLTGLTKLFGDVLSYLRLFALGLASSSLAVTFNEMASSLRDSVPGLGVLLALLVLVVGHGINLALSVVSGVVHGMRLNFIEFFNWSLADEGYAFRPFARKETES